MLTAAVVPMRALLEDTGVETVGWTVMAVPRRPSPALKGVPRCAIVHAGSAEPLLLLACTAVELSRTCDELVALLVVVWDRVMSWGICMADVRETD